MRGNLGHLLTLAEAILYYGTICTQYTYVFWVLTILVVFQLFANDIRQYRFKSVLTVSTKPG